MSSRLDRDSSRPVAAPRSFAARLAIAACIGTAVAAMGACGSRTGLFGGEALIGPEGGSLPEAGTPETAPDGAVKCTPGRFAFELATAQLMFVIDRSGSMAFSLNGREPVNGQLPAGVLSRWETLRDALFQTITPFDNALAMGAKFYPEELVRLPGGIPADEACRTDVGVAIPPARGNVSSIIDVFDRTTPLGGTPTSEAIRLAAQYIAGTRTVARTMIVATDGAPNCNPDLDATSCTCTSVRGNCASAPGGEYNCLDDNRGISVIRDIFEKQKIPVFVIGIGSTERPEFIKVLDDMAVAGGRARPTAPRHYNVQSSAELKTALGSISDSIAKCTYLTPSSPTDPDAISVEIDGQAVARDPSHTNGWDWVDQAYGTLAFFGTSCARASTGTPQISGVVRCESP